MRPADEKRERKREISNKILCCWWFGDDFSVPHNDRATMMNEWLCSCAELFGLFSSMFWFLAHLSLFQAVTSSCFQADYLMALKIIAADNHFYWRNSKGQTDSAVCKYSICTRTSNLHWSLVYKSLWSLLINAHRPRAETVKKKKTSVQVFNTNDLFNLKGKWDKQLIPVKLGRWWDLIHTAVCWSEFWFRLIETQAHHIKLWIWKEVWNFNEALLEMLRH